MASELLHISATTMMLSGDTVELLHSSSVTLLLSSTQREIYKALQLLSRTGQSSRQHSHILHQQKKKIPSTLSTFVHCFSKGSELHIKGLKCYLPKTADNCQVNHSDLMAQSQLLQLSHQSKPARHQNKTVRVTSPYHQRKTKQKWLFLKRPFREPPSPYQSHLRSFYQAYIPQTLQLHMLLF